MTPPRITDADLSLLLEALDILECDYCPGDDEAHEAVMLADIERVRSKLIRIRIAREARSKREA